MTQLEKWRFCTIFLIILIIFLVVLSFFLILGGFCPSAPKLILPCWTLVAATRRLCTEYRHQVSVVASADLGWCLLFSCILCRSASHSISTCTAATLRRGAGRPLLVSHCSRAWLFSADLLWSVLLSCTSIGEQERSLLWPTLFHLWFVLCCGFFMACPWAFLNPSKDSPPQQKSFAQALNSSFDIPVS